MKAASHVSLASPSGGCPTLSAARHRSRRYLGWGGSFSSFSSGRSGGSGGSSSRGGSGGSSSSGGSGGSSSRGGWGGSGSVSRLP